MIFKRILCLTSFLLLTACQSAERGSVEASLKRGLQQPLVSAQKPAVAPLQNLPGAVNQALLPPPSPSTSPLLSEPRYDINANQVAAADFFAGLVKDSPYSVAIHPQVAGSITLDLKQVQLSQVFELVSEIYGFDIQQSHNIYRVYPAGMRTETFSVNYLLMKRNGNTQTSIISGGVTQDGNSSNRSSSNLNNNFSGSSSNNASNSSSAFGNSTSSINGTNINTTTETDFWEDLQKTLQAMIGAAEGRSVFVTPQAGLVTVKALPDEIRSVKEFLRLSEEVVQRQVVLEARILEVTLKDEYQQGINWSQVVAHSGSTDFKFSSTAGTMGNQVSAALGGLASLSFVNQDFSGVLSLLSTQGNVQVLSSPRVTAINNQKAVIKVGDDEYFVTDVSSQNTITSTTTSVVPDIELTPFFSGIALDVTPQIDDNDSVLLHVHPSVIETEEQEKVVTLNEEQIVLPLAQSTIRESDTVIRANSGEIVVIGGLMQSIVSETDAKTPLLGDIPLLGELFTSRRDLETKKELIILLKPTVVGPNTWREQMQMSRDQLTDWLYVE